MNINELFSSSSELTNRMNEVKAFRSKWAKTGLLEGLNTQDSAQLATLLENQVQHLKEVATITTNLGSPQVQYTGGYGDQWNQIVLPLYRRAFGKIMAKEFLSTQSMSAPTGLIFYLDFKYANDKFVHKAGDSVYSMIQGKNATDITKGFYGSGRGYYSSNYRSASVTATASPVTFRDVNYDDAYKATGSLVKLTIPTAGLDRFDVHAARGFVLRSGSVDSAKLKQQFTTVAPDEATISFIVDAPAATGTYQAFYLFTTDDAHRGDFEDRADFSVPNASSATKIVIPKFKPEFRQEAISAKTKKLASSWTQESTTDMKNYQNIDAEAEMTKLTSEYIALEIDVELLEMMIDSAPTVAYWSAQNNSFWNGNGFDAPVSVGAGGYYNTQGGWFATLGTTLRGVSNRIHQLTMKGGANFLLTSPSVSTVIESIAGYASDTDGTSEQYNFGAEKIGSLNSQYKVYKMPYMVENLIFMGYKGNSILEAGAVYAPYVPLMSTDVVYDPETFTMSKGLATRYAKKMIRGEFYGKVYVSGLDTV